METSRSLHHPNSTGRIKIREKYAGPQPGASSAVEILRIGLERVEMRTLNESDLRAATI